MFLPLNVTFLIQPMDQGVIVSRMTIKKKIHSEGNNALEKTLRYVKQQFTTPVNILNFKRLKFWRDYIADNGIKKKKIRDFFKVKI